jgi:hypothetical protein
LAAMLAAGPLHHLGTFSDQSGLGCIAWTGAPLRFTLDQNALGFEALGDPPPLKWSVLRYGFEPEEDREGEEGAHPEEIVAERRPVDVLVSQGFCQGSRQRAGQCGLAWV